MKRAKGLNTKGKNGKLKNSPFSLLTKNVQICIFTGILHLMGRPDGTKNCSGTNDALVTISLEKEKYQTSVKERAKDPVEWSEQCEL